jgi:hypothetical protein
MLNLQALEQAFAPVNQVGRGTIEADIGGTIVTLEALLPHEEVAVQKYAAAAMEENKDTMSANTDYLDRFQTSLLAHAVAKIGDIHIKGSDHVETGEVLPNGVAVKIPRVDAVLRIATKWSRPIRQFLFNKYSELVERLDLESEQVIKYDLFDLAAEIQRTENRLADLQKRKADRASEQEAKHPFRQQVETFAKAEDTPVPVQQAPVAPVPPPVAPVPAPQAPVPVQQARQPIIPVAPPPPVQVRPEPNPPANAVLDNIEAASQPDELADVEAQMAAENARLYRIREAQRNAAQQVRENRGVPEGFTRQETPKGYDPPPTVPVMPSRPPPHMAAHEAAVELGAMSQRVGDVDGIEAYRIGQVPTLNDKAQPRNLAGATVDPRSDRGTQNPRFRRG